MPPKKKQEASKKTVQKKKQQAIEDKTFGLKNKNKSKKIMQFVQSVERNVMNSGDPAQRKAEEARKKAKEEAKLRKKLQKEEQDALFSEALLAVQKKSTTALSSGKVEAKGRDGDDDETGANKKATSRAMKMMYQMDAQEMNDKLREDPNYVPTLEDEIEMLRSKLVADLKQQGKAGTPVTPESFAVWQEKKRQKRAAEAAKKVEAELKKKKGGKGLSVLSGRDLYEYKRELFTKVDDEGGGDIALTRSTTRSDDDEDAADDNNDGVALVAQKVQSDLFLEGNDDDLDDIEDD